VADSGERGEKSLSEEGSADSDDGIRERAESMSRFLQEKKVRNVWLLAPGSSCAYADYLIFGDVEHDRHRDAALEQLDRQFSRKDEPFRTEKGGHWTLADLGTIIVHLFQDGGRSLYRLEDLFPDAPIWVFADDGRATFLSPEQRPLPDLPSREGVRRVSRPARSPIPGGT
jgi:ribosome-associated protein